MEFNITEESPWRKYFVSLVIILVAIVSFGVGRLTSVGNPEPIKIEYDQSLTSSAIQAIPNKNEIVASKNGKKYHYFHCSGAKTISEKNKITFTSPQAAEASGYTLASNCKAP